MPSTRALLLVVDKLCVDFLAAKIGHRNGAALAILGDFDSTVDRGVQEWVPEPNTLTLFASGLVLAGIARIYRTNC